MITAYYHVYITEDPGITFGIVSEQMKCMENSELVDAIDTLKVNMIARNRKYAMILAELIQSYGIRHIDLDIIPNIYYTDYQMLENLESNSTVTENYTMRKIWNDSQDNDCSVLYFHTKGATAFLNHLINYRYETYRRYEAWRQYLNWGVLENWYKAMVLPMDYDVFGVNYQTHPSPHISGNFWWSKSKHIRNLPDPATKEWWYELKKNTSDDWLKNASDRFRDEQWVCSKPNTKVLEIHKLDENPAFSYTPRWKYAKEK